MRIGLYPRLAAEGIRKNRQMYLPYILACVGMVMMTYLIIFLQHAEAIAALPGGDVVQTFMGVGVVAIVFFATLFLFYTNAFLMKRRKKEFGLYYVLGMGKGNLGRILFWESLYIAILSLSLGLIFGIAFSKLVELGFVNLLRGQITYSLSVPAEAVLLTMLPFGAIFALLFFNSLRQIWFSGAVSLLKSENSGEKPPRANWALGILGVLVLGTAYYLSITIRDPVSALTVFLVAVLLVILGTYLLMIAGSVLFCRILQKRKRYYYKPDHFISVASMVYRMKRNGAGLASICILATMVLVMISSTSALFIGGEDVIRSRYPREIDISFRNYDHRGMSAEELSLFYDTVDDVLERCGAKKRNVERYTSVVTAGYLEGGQMIYDSSTVENFSLRDFSSVYQIYLIPLEDYNGMMGTNAELAEDEVLIFSPRTGYTGDTFGFVGHRQYRVKEVVKEAFISPDVAMDIAPPIMVVTADLFGMREGITDQAGNELTYQKWYYCFDTSLGNEEDIALMQELQTTLRELEKNGHDAVASSVECREYGRQGFYAIYGGLFYLGIILSIVFLFAAVLIIYYKQISEGYEDQARFEIMRKVGLTKRNIRRSVNSQLLTVFFLPLAGAGLHLAFAFPIIVKLLLLFNLNNRRLFAGTCVGSFLVFALLYTVVYRITSNVYYQIVSGSYRRAEPVEKTPKRN